MTKLARFVREHGLEPAQAAREVTAEEVSTDPQLRLLKSSLLPLQPAPSLHGERR